MSFDDAFLALLLLVSAFSLSASSQAKAKLSDLKNNVGDSVMVEGRVKRVQQVGDTNNLSTLITFGANNNSVYLVISSAVRKKISVRPEEVYKNKSIRVIGRLVNNNKRMQIVISVISNRNDR